jgi:hypothetical protein
MTVYLSNELQRHLAFLAPKMICDIPHTAALGRGYLATSGPTRTRFAAPCRSVASSRRLHTRTCKPGQLLSFLGGC